MEREKLPGTLMLWPGVAEELVGGQGVVRARRRCSRTSTSACSRTSATTSACRGATGGGNGLVSVEYTFEGETAHSAGAPWRGRSALDAVELMNVGWNYPPRASAPAAALALRHHQRRRPAQRRAAQRQRLVLLPRDRLPAHQGAVGHRQQDGRRRRADDRHQVDVAHPRHGVAAAHEQDRWPRRCTRTSRRSACRRGARPIRRWPRRCRRSSATRRRQGWRRSSTSSASRSPKRTSAAAAPTTSATCRGTCRR